MNADFNIPPDILETNPGRSERQAAEIEPSMLPRDLKEYVRGVAVLIDPIARNSQRKQVDELIANLSAVRCNASVVMCKIGNDAISISSYNDRSDGLLQNEGF